MSGVLYSTLALHHRFGLGLDVTGNGKRVAAGELRQEQLTEIRTPCSPSPSFWRIVTSGVTPSPGISRVVVSRHLARHVRHVLEVHVARPVSPCRIFILLSPDQK